MSKTMIVQVGGVISTIETDRPTVGELAKKLNRGKGENLADMELEEILILRGKAADTIGISSAFRQVETLAHLGHVFFRDMDKAELDAESTEEHLSNLLLTLHQKVRELDLITCERMGGTVV